MLGVITYDPRALSTHPPKEKVWVPFQVAIKSSPMKSWSLYFQPALWAAKTALKNVHQILSWGDKPWGYPKWPHQQWPEAGPCRFCQAFPPPFSSRPAAEKSPAPCASKRGPWNGARGKVPAGQTPSPCSELALLSTSSQPPQSDEGSGRVGPGLVEPRGLHRTVERAKTQDHDRIKTKGTGITSKNT